MPPLSRFRALLRGKSSVTGEHSSPQSFYRLSAPPPLEIKSSPTPDSDGMSFPQRYVQVAQDLRSSLPPTCRWLGPEDVDLVGKRPIAAGGFADIYEATHDGRKVVLKSQRCYVAFDVVQTAAVRRNHRLCRVHR